MICDFSLSYVLTFYYIYGFETFLFLLPNAAHMIIKPTWIATNKINAVIVNLPYIPPIIRSKNVKIPELA